MIDEKTALRNTVLEYVQSYYKRHSSVPSVRALVGEFGKQGLTNKNFYIIFQGGLAEICRECSLPVPRRLTNTKKALKARTAKGHAGSKEKAVRGESSATQLMLTEAQTNRLLGMSHLEGGKAPLLLIDDLLDRDATIRKLLEKTENIGGLISFVEKGLSRGWMIDYLLNITTWLWNHDIMSLPATDIDRLIGLLRELERHDVDPKKFVADMMNARSTVSVWREYNLGSITAEEAFRRMNLKP